MGIFCMIFGVIVFLGSLSGGYFLPLVNLFGGMQLVPTPTTPSDYIVLYAICGFAGILMGLPIFMQGMIYQKIGSMNRRRRRRHDSEE